MKTPFKMKSGNSPAFKTMGSSPLQQPYKHGAGSTGGKAEYMFKMPAGTASNIPNTSTLPDGTVIDFDASKRQVINSNKKKSSTNFNTKGTKTSTTPNYSTTKAAKTQNLRNEANKIKTVSSKTNKNGKVVQLLKKGKNVAKKVINHPVSKKVITTAKKVYNHPVTKKVVRIGKGLGNIGLKNVNALFMMPAPLFEGEQKFGPHEWSKKSSKKKVNNKA